jgi:hypothetical protein
MSTFTVDNNAQARDATYIPGPAPISAWRSSTVSNVKTDLPTKLGSAITFTSTSTDSTPSTITTSQTNPQLTCQQPVIFEPEHLEMATFYHYDASGNLKSTFVGESLPLAQQGSAQLDMTYYMQAGDPVGAFLAQRVMTHPEHVSSEVYGHPIVEEGDYKLHTKSHAAALQNSGLRHQDMEVHESYGQHSDIYPGSAYTRGHMLVCSHSSPHHPYPDPEHIRHLHTLQSLLPHIDPARKMRSTQGPTVNVIEQDTNTVFAFAVPKKLLVLFFGRRKVTQFIKTVGLRDMNRSDHQNNIQQLCIPPRISSSSAFKILVSWMKRACMPDTMNRMRQFNIPKHTFAACTLAQTLALFGLHKDAQRVDCKIAQEHLRRPIFAAELESLWNCLGENNRYTYAVIKVVGERLLEFGVDDGTDTRMWREILELMAKIPELDARVRDLELNEQYRPTFDTEWCKKLERRPRFDRPHHEG